MLNSSLIWYIAWGAIPAILSILLFIFTKSKASISSRPVEKETGPGKPDDGVVSNAGTVLSKLVDNPFKHMIINVSGAAALFLILMFLMNPIKMGFFIKQSDWSMKVKFKDEKGQPIPVSHLSAMELVPQPKKEVYDDYTILVDLDDLLEENSRLKINYDVRFFFEGFETISIPLQDSINSKKFCNRSLDTRTIELLPRNLVRRYKEASIVTTPDSATQVPAPTFSLDN